MAVRKGERKFLDWLNAQLDRMKTDGNVYDLVLERKWLSKAELDDLLRPENMTDPRQIPK